MRPARVSGSRLCAPALAALALLVAGCGSGSHAKGRPQRPATTHTTAPATTTQATTTTTLPGTGHPVITLGDKNTPEQFILGELYDMALEAQGFEVTLTRNIGPTSVSLQAAEQGSLDVYPEYLNVLDGLAGQPQPLRSKEAAYAVGSTYAAGHGLQLLTPTPFSDTEGLAVLSSYAEVHRLRTLADLTGLTSLTIGAPVEFSQTPTGLPAIEQAYGFKPTAVEPVDIGSQYAALQAGQVQAAYANTTDGQLAGPSFRMLTDSRHVLGFGNVVPVVSQQAVTEEGPVFAATLDRVDRLLTTPVMRELNAEATLDHADSGAIAHQFLESHGLLPVPSGPA